LPLTRPDTYRGFTAVWGLTAQAIMAFLGYVAACFAAATFATFAISSTGLADVRGEWEQLFQVTLFIVSTGIGALVSAFWPFVVVLVITEAFKLRGFVVHLVAGALVGLIYGLPVAEFLAGAPLPALRVKALQLAVASGAVGGFVYWMVAGRTAGRWLELPWFERNRR
jgi:hypothetical protein